MSQLIELNRHYLEKWPTIAAYLVERPELTGWLLVSDQQPCSLLIGAPDRIHYIYTPEDSRRGGYATELLNLVLASAWRKPQVFAAVAKADLATLSVFLKNDFQIIGFQHNPTTPTYLLEYVKPPLVITHNDRLGIDRDCADLINKIHVVESLPVYL